MFDWAGFLCQFPFWTQPQNQMGIFRLSITPLSHQRNVETSEIMIRIFFVPTSHQIKKSFTYRCYTALIVKKNNNNNVFYLLCFCVTFCGPSVFILLQFLVAAAQWRQAALPLSTPPTSVKHSTVNSVWFEVDTHAKTLSSAFFI